MGDERPQGSGVYAPEPCRCVSLGNFQPPFPGSIQPALTWTGHRVSSLRRVHGIRAYRSAEKDGEWLTQYEAAAALGISRHRLVRLINAGLIVAEQVVPGAPYQIRASDLREQRVLAAVGRKGEPCRLASEDQLSMFPDT